MLEPPLIGVTNVTAGLHQEETSNTKYVYVCRIKITCSLFLLGEFIWGHIAQLEMKPSCNSIVCVYIILFLYGCFQCLNSKKSVEKKHSESFSFIQFLLLNAKL